MSLIAAGTLMAFVPWARLARHVFPPPPVLAGAVHVQEPPGGLRQLAIRLLATKQDRERFKQLQAIQRQANAYQSRLLVDEARKAKADNDYTRALDLYNQALGLDPTNVFATLGRKEMLAYLGLDPAPGHGERDLVVINDGHSNQITWDFDTASKDAAEAILRGDWAEADKAIERGRAAIATDPGIFAPFELRRFEEQLAYLRKRLDEARGSAGGNSPPPGGRGN